MTTCLSRICSALLFRREVKPLSVNDSRSMAISTASTATSARKTVLNTDLSRSFSVSFSLFMCMIFKAVHSFRRRPFSPRSS